jgi:hypothetical protein
MRKHATADRAEAATYTQNAKDFQRQADAARQCAAHFTSMADGWEQTADKLASGAISLGDANVLAELRGGLAEAKDAIDPKLPFAAQRVQLAAADAGRPVDLSKTPLAIAFGRAVPVPVEHYDADEAAADYWAEQAVLAEAADFAAAAEPGLEADL